MRYYQIDIFKRGAFQESHIFTSTLNIKAVLILAYYHLFGKRPRLSWADKKLNWGQAWSNGRQCWKAVNECQITQLHDDEFVSMKEAHAARLAEFGPYLLTERRAA